MEEATRTATTRHCTRSYQQRCHGRILADQIIRGNHGQGSIAQTRLHPGQKHRQDADRLPRFLDRRSCAAPQSSSELWICGLLLVVMPTAIESRTLLNAFARSESEEAGVDGAAAGGAEGAVGSTINFLRCAKRLARNLLPAVQPGNRIRALLDRKSAVHQIVDSTSILVKKFGPVEQPFSATNSMGVRAVMLHGSLAGFA